MIPSTHHSVRSNITFAFAIALALALSWHLRGVIMIVYMSALFAVVLMPIAHAIMNIKLGRGKITLIHAILIQIFIMIGAIVLFATFALPPIARDLQEFAKELPSRTPALVERTHHLPFVQHLNLQAVTNKMQDTASNLATYVFLSIGNWAGKVVNVITTIVLTIYFMLEGEETYTWLLSFFPPAARQRLDLTLRRAKVRMGKWLLGQGALMVILGVVSTVVFLSLHVRYAYALGVMMGAFNIIPVAGALVSMAFVLLVAGVDSWGRVAGALIFYVIWAQLENTFLVPRIMKSSVGLSGLAVLIALLLGGELAGIAGALVAVPTAVLVAVLIDEYLVNRDPVPANLPTGE